MINWILGFIAAALWGGAYGWYFSREARLMWWRRRHRKAIAERQRVEAYAAMMRRPWPPRTRAGPHPQASGPTPFSTNFGGSPPGPQATPASAVIIPFRGRNRPG